MNDLATVQRTQTLATAHGWQSRMSDCQHVDGTVTLNLERGKEWIEVVFVPHLVTRYWRFRCAYVHHDNGADRIETLRATREHIALNP